MKDDLVFNQVDINLGALKANYRTLKSLINQRPLMAVVKGDGYGHGLVESAKAFVEAGAQDLGVLDVLEGLTLRGVLPPEVNIHILAGLQTPGQIQAALDHNLTLVIYSLPQLKLIQEAMPIGSKARAYLKVDTGMGRLGLPYWAAESILTSLKDASGLVFLGLMTHLATAGDSESVRQLERFNRLKEVDQKLGVTLGQHSALAGPGVLAFPDYPDQLSRAGLPLYGANPLVGQKAPIPLKSQKAISDLKPVMAFSSQIIQTRTLKTGESLSYDRTFIAPYDIKVAALPVGYVHGLSRSRSSQGVALIEGQRAPLLGRVCMNLSLFDISLIPEAKPGQKAIIVGGEGPLAIPIEEAAKWQGTSAYESLCLFGRLNARNYY
ncbi:MAG: alanine racemase [Deltaproteobacteria bacterium]|jgi:alanine racemase|nr:alanine racemase [Deltaproteobacteria bacterium]